MSCENTDELRIITKYSSFPGETPTIPISGDHNDGTWLPTDLYVGEMFVNVADNKAWVRGMDGIFQIGATGGSFSFTGDYVYKSTGGTYSGNVYAPTFSSIGVVAQNIQANIISATYFVGGSFVGDGSGLTGINANWLGGSVSNPSSFSSNFGLYGPVVIDGTISSTDNIVDICSDVNVGCGYGVSASYFVGDGSQLTNLPIGTYSNFYTISATLSGTEIQFNRNDLSPAYTVDLSPILSTYSIANFNFDNITNEITIELNSGEQFTTIINSFDTLSVLNSINTGEVYANTFYGSFVGTYSNDIYTTSANLYGTDAVFTRTDGITYSLDLSTFSGGGGATGPAGATGATGSNGLTPYMVISYNSTGLTLATGSVTLPITTTLLIGWSQGTRVRIWNDDTHYMEGQITTAMTYPQVAGNDIIVDVDYVVGTGTLGVWRVFVTGDVGSAATGASQSLAQTLVIGNNTGLNDIILSNSTFTGDSDSIKAFGNTIADAKFSFEDYGGGAWAPTIKTQNGNSTNYITVGDSETYIHNSQADAFVDRYGQIEVGPTQITTSLNDLANGEGTAFVMTSTSIVVGNQATTPNVFPGIEYDIDYSANFTNRSLVDKEYVDSVAGGGLTWSGVADYLSYFDTADSLRQTDIYYDGRYTIGHGAGWDYDSYSKFGIYDPSSPGPAITAEGSQFGGTFIARGANGGQNIGLQAYAQKSTISGNLAMYGRADGTQSNNTAAYFVAEGGTLYPSYTGYDNLGVDIYVDSQNSVSPNGVTNSGIRIGVYGRGGDNNYVGQFRDGREGIGKVLTCITADGIATWQTPTGGGGGTFSGGTVSGATTFQSDVTFNANVLDESGASIDMTNMINSSLITLMYNT